MKGTIQVRGLKKSYDSHMVLNGIDVQIEKGEIFALLGVNGAGKTTTLECIEGLRRYDSGSIMVNGRMGIQLQSSSLPAHIKPMEAVKLFAKWHKTTIDHAMLEALGIKEMEKKQYIQLSTGQKRRLHLALSLINDPDVVFLDEPTAGLDPKERVRFRNLLSEYAGDKIVILSTHIVSDIEAIADEVLLMKKGKFVLQGTVPELIHKANGKVWELSVSPQEARQWQTKTTVANLRHEGKEIILRIISDNMPSERAVPCEATLEDLYLFYFPTEEGVK